MAPKGGSPKIKYIEDKRRRNVAQKKRLAIVQKKAGELAVLCDAPVGLIAYCQGKAQPVVWPSPEGVSAVLKKYRDLPDKKRYRNNLKSTEFLKQAKEKVRTKLANVQRQIQDEEIKLVINDSLAGRRKSFDDLPIEIVTSVQSRAQAKLQAVMARLQELRSAAASAPPAPAPVDVPVVDTSAMVQPRHDSHLFEALDGITLPTTEEMHALFMQDGLVILARSLES